MPVPIITPAGPLLRDGMTTTHFVSDQAVTWATTGGVLFNTVFNATDWTAPNKSGIWYVSGDNGPDAPGIVTVNVKALFPAYWQYRIPIKATKPVLAFKPTYGPTQTRTYGPGALQLDWELGNDDNSWAEFMEVRDFWAYHYPGKVFDLIDPLIPERRSYEFDSDLSYQYNPSGDSFAWSVRIREAYPYASTVP